MFVQDYLHMKKKRLVVTKSREAKDRNLEAALGDLLVEVFILGG